MNRVDGGEQGGQEWGRGREGVRQNKSRTYGNTLTSSTLARSTLLK